MVGLTRPNDQHRFVSGFAIDGVGLTRPTSVLRRLISGVAIDGWPYTPQRGPAQIRLWLRHRWCGSHTPNEGPA